MDCKNIDKNVPSYIAIEGCIGVGKTTLCKSLATRMGAKELLEEVEENPFLSGFYKDKTSLAFKTQIFFLLSRHKQQESLTQIDLFNHCVVSDYLMLKDQIFAELTLTQGELSLYNQIFKALCTHIVTPQVVVYLRAPIETVLARIKKRGREFEKSMDADYLLRLMDSYDRFFANFRSCPVLIVETEELDFPNNESDLTRFVDALAETYARQKNTHLITKGTRSQLGLFEAHQTTGP